MVSPRKVLEAVARVRGHVRRTPLVPSCLSVLPGRPRYYFKCENMQIGGSFKVRGATNKISQLPESVKNVITHSSGNHAIAVSLTAKKFDKTARIVIPKAASKAKQKYLKELGVEMYHSESTMKSREAKIAEIIRENEWTEQDYCLVHSFNDPDIVYGQSTLMIEILEDWYGCSILTDDSSQIRRVKEKASDPSSKLDAVVVSVGGGGMMSGCVLGLKIFNDIYGLTNDLNTKLIVTEPETADDAHRYWQSKGEIYDPNPNPDTIAEGLKMGIGPITRQLMMDYKDEIVLSVMTVKEDEIKQSMIDTLFHHKLLIETSAAVATSVMFDYLPEYNELVNQHQFQNVAIHICGGNVNQELLSDILGF